MPIYNIQTIVRFAIFAITSVSAEAGVLFIKLIDERERPVMNAEFYWKRPDQEEYRSFRSPGTRQSGNGQIVGHAEGFLYNYEIAKSVFVGGDDVDIKVVAQGYEVKVLRDRIPDGNDRGESQILVVLQALPSGRQSRPNSEVPHQGGLAEHDRIKPAHIDLMIRNQVDPRIDDGPPLSGVMVEIQMEGTGQNYSVQTDGSGAAKFDVPTFGMAEIRLTKSGYRDRHWRTRLEPGGTERQRLTLSPLATSKKK